MNKPKAAENFCSFNEIDNICRLKGVLTFDEAIIFKSKVIIEPGTKITLIEQGNLIFNSSVLINGSKENPISFEGKGTGGIYIKNNKNQISVIQNSNFYNLSTMNSLLNRYTGSINGYGGTFYIDNISISNGDAEDQLNIINAKVDISNLKIFNAVSDAFDCDFCEGAIKNIILKDIGGDGLDISGSNLNVINMKAEDIKDKAFSVGEKSYAAINDAEYENIATGIAVKDSSVVKASNITFKDVGYDSFMTYVKKPFYKGETRLEVKQYSVSGEIRSNLCVREKGTNLIINDKNCDISEIDIDELYQGRMKK